MKEKIEQLAKGIFEYENPNLILSEEVLLVCVEEGKTFRSSFTVKNDENKYIKGIVYSSSELLKIKENKFFGIENVIEYEFMTSFLSAGEILKGEISIVSSVGEIEIPFICEIEEPYCMTSLGKTKDLFHFANLAKTSWEEALRIFKSQEFERVFLYHDLELQIIYKSLIKSSSVNQALEEFLISIHKKLRIKLSLNKSNIELILNKTPIMEKIIITKDNWGYTKIKVSTDAPFIQLAQQHILTENFLGNTFLLECVMNPDKMRIGNNYGRIFLQTAHQAIKIEVICRCSEEQKTQDSNNKKSKLYKEKLVTNYLDFRNNTITAQEYILETELIVENISSLEINNRLDEEKVELVEANNRWNELIKTHLHIISNNQEKAESMIAKLATKVEEDKSNEAYYYCGYLYLNALFTKDKSKVEEAAKIITYYYENGYKSLPLLWYLLYLDKRYENKSTKFKALKEQYMSGCNSPILYYEAYSLLKEEPILLEKLDFFEIQTINWSIKNKVITENMMTQFVFLANKEKGFHRIVFNSLVKLYEQYKSKEILTAICAILIKGHKSGKKYFDWYQLGVDAQLRLTELYEYYMYSIDETTDVALSQQVLLYFNYNSNLSDKKTAYLYANIIKQRENNPLIYKSYLKYIGKFVLKQIGLHNISHDLSIIYEQFINRDSIDNDIAKNLPFVLFAHEVTCTNTNMKGILVVHKELDEEVYYPFIDGKTKINIYTENPDLFLVDSSETRYISNNDYTIKQLIHFEECMAKCFELNPNNYMLLLHISEKAHYYQKMDAASIEIKKKSLEIVKLRDIYVNKYLQSLIYHYYDNYDSYEGELIESYLRQIDLQKFSGSERKVMIEHMITSNLHNKEHEVLVHYGFEGIAVKKLMKLCSKLIRISDLDKKDEFLLSFGYYVFCKGKQDETILKYLVEHYHGATKDMFKVFAAAKNADINTKVLEEKLLGQVLFSESCCINSFQVFHSYYMDGGNRKLIRAFLSYNAYKYLLYDRMIETELFDLIRRENNYEENDITMLAYLKYFSTCSNLSKEDIDFVDFNINRFIEKGMILPFFKEYKDKINLPENICNKYYVEYKTNPKNKVMINYVIDNEYSQEVYQCQTMKNVFYGIFVKELILFYDERLQYYITEKNGDRENITASFNVKLDNMIEDEHETKFNQINLMLMTKEVGDDKTLLDMMKNYVESVYLTSELFTPIE